ncbi:hypothetical protein CS176_1024 [Corynebacterium glutamicum]|nr:hypothetical protein CS176_1024 [Corynebacterium glutamicum]
MRWEIHDFSRDMLVYLRSDNLIPVEIKERTKAEKA